MFKVTSMRSLVILEETGGFCSYPYWAPSNFYHLLPLSHWGGPHQKWYPFSNMDMENDEQTWRLETLKIHQPWKSKTMKRIVLWGIACDKNDTLTKNQWFLAQRPFKVFGLSGSIHLSGVFVNRIPLKHFSFQDRYPCNCRGVQNCNSRSYWKLLPNTWQSVTLQRHDESGLERQVIDAFGIRHLWRIWKVMLNLLLLYRTYVSIIQEVFLQIWNMYSKPVVVLSHIWACVLTHERLWKYLIGEGSCHVRTQSPNRRSVVEMCQFGWISEVYLGRQKRTWNLNMMLWNRMFLSIVWIVGVHFDS